MTFQINALSAENFAHLFALDDAQLQAQNARRYEVTSNPGFPCRVSLEDARVGESVILVHFEHQSADTPYRASHAIFVRDVHTAQPNVGEVPEVLRLRLLSVRGFSADHLMVDADVVEGVDLATTLTSMFADARIDYVHVHYAKPGCFAASVVRA